MKIVFLRLRRKSVLLYYNLYTQTVCIIMYVLYICKKNKEQNQKSRIATVHWMTLYTQLTVYDAINMDIQYATPHNPIKT